MSMSDLVNKYIIDKSLKKESLSDPSKSVISKRVIYDIEELMAGMDLEMQDEEHFRETIGAEIL